MMNENNFSNTVEQATAFQKIWMESISKTMQAAFTVSPSVPPSDMLLQFRGGIFKALSDSWEEFMRSPQFLEGMQQWMEHTVTFRKMTNDLMGKMRNEMQSPSREDIDGVMVSVRHIEKRLLDRVDKLSAQLNELKAQVAELEQMRPAPQAAAKQTSSSSRKTTANAKKGANT